MRPTRARVLLADDHPGVVRALSRVLSFDCDVVGHVADGGQVAMAAATLQPVIVLVDVNLPNVNGLDVCRQIVQENPHARVIVMTAMLDAALRDSALAAGASGFFDKCAAFDQLAGAIKRIWADMT